MPSIVPHLPRSARPALLRLVALAIGAFVVLAPAHALAAVGMCGEDAQSVVAPLIQWAPPGSEARAACPEEARRWSDGLPPSDPAEAPLPASSSERCLPASIRWPLPGRHAHQPVASGAEAPLVESVSRGVYRPPR